jgi:hypothetical protein
LTLMVVTSGEVCTVSGIVRPMYSAESFKFIEREQEGQTAPQAWTAVCAGEPSRLLTNG